MKFSVQEEYGLRCLIRVAQIFGSEKGITIPEISKAENIAEHSVAKIMRLLRIGGFVESARGQIGGYTLAISPENIKIIDVLESLGGKLYDKSFCENHSTDGQLCSHTIDCSVKSVWVRIQRAVDNALNNLTLAELIKTF